MEPAKPQIAVAYVHTAMGRRANKIVYARTYLPKCGAHRASWRQELAGRRACQAMRHARKIKKRSPADQVKRKKTSP